MLQLRAPHPQQTICLLRRGRRRRQRCIPYPDRRWCWRPRSTCSYCNNNSSAVGELYRVLDAARAELLDAGGGGGGVCLASPWRNRIGPDRIEALRRADLIVADADAVTVGRMYDFVLAWSVPLVPGAPCAALQRRHRFSVTVGLERDLHVYAHTSQLCLQPTCGADVDAVFDDTDAGRMPLCDARSVCPAPPPPTTTTATSSASLATASNRSSRALHWLHRWLLQLHRGPPADELQPPDARRPRPLRVLTYNIWNYNVHPLPPVPVCTVAEPTTGYASRLLAITRMLRAADADIVALQEVRYDQLRGGALGHAQIAHLSRLLPYDQFVYQPAMLYRDGDARTRVEEGLAVLSRFPIVAHDYRLLSRNRTNPLDSHQRICLHAAIATPLGRLHVFVTHFPHPAEQQLRVAQEVLDYMADVRGADGAPQVLLGDLNTTPSAPAIALLSRHLRDAWPEVHPHDAGATFSALDRVPQKRIDYVFYRAGDRSAAALTAVRADLLGGRDAASEQLPPSSSSSSSSSSPPPSDHLGVAVDFAAVPRP